MGQWYFKIGCTTDISSGVFHGTEVTLRTDKSKGFAAALTQYDKTGKRHRLSEPVENVEEHKIVNAKHGETLHRQGGLLSRGRQVYPDLVPVKKSEYIQARYISAVEEAETGVDNRNITAT